MKPRASSYRKTANVFLSVVLALGLVPVPAFATGDAADEAATALTPPIASEPLTASAAPGAAADASATFAAPSASNLVNAPATPSAPAPSALAAAAPAAEPVAAVPADATLTPGWTQSGTCEWMIDATGKLTIRPLGNGASGSLGTLSGNAPWYDQRASITSVAVEPGVSTN